MDPQRVIWAISRPADQPREHAFDTGTFLIIGKRMRTRNKNKTKHKTLFRVIHFELSKALRPNESRKSQRIEKIGVIKGTVQRKL